MNDTARGKRCAVGRVKPRERGHPARTRFFLVLVVAALPTLFAASGCGPSTEQLLAVDYAPMPGDDWSVSTPEAQGLDPLRVARLYFDASRLKTTYAVLVVKNGHLVAEGYFNEGSIDQHARLQSATKSVTSALVGLALEQHCLSSPDQKMMDFFPELAGRIDDARKTQITIRDLLQMRAGYPWAGFEYSSLSSHLLGVIVARACDTDLRSFAEEHLFSPIGVEAGEWIRDWEGYFNGHGDLHLTARDMARFGLLYQNDGVYDGWPVIPADWVHASLRTYSEDAWKHRVGRNFRHIGYGYQWWSAVAEERRFNFAWGHGGQVIALVDELDMVVVVTADPLVGLHGGGPWRKEKANLNLVGNFIASLATD